MSISARTEFYAIKDGQFYLVTETHQRLDLPTGTLAKIVQESGVKLTKLFDAGLVGGMTSSIVGCSIQAGAANFTVPIDTITIRARFHMGADKMMGPDFAARLVPTSVAPMVIDWKTPLNMKLYLMVSVAPTGSRLYVVNTFLFAMDKDKRVYRLPTSNVYEDCRVCMGDFDSTSDTHVDCISKAVTQFRTSDWNADLAHRGGSTSMEWAMKLFRFKPLEPEGFEQQAPTEDWTKLCTKISNEFINANFSNIP